MVAEHPYRLRLGRVDVPDDLFRDGVAATVTDDFGAVVLVVSRRAETRNGDGASAVPLTVVTAEGDLDRDTVALLRHALIQALDDGGPVCCDLARVTFFGAAAANLAFHAHARATTAGQQFLLRGASATTRRVLDVVDPGRILQRS
jgi:anti-anti-sigma factor